MHVRHMYMLQTGTDLVCQCNKRCDTLHKARAACISSICEQNMLLGLCTSVETGFVLQAVLTAAFVYGAQPLGALCIS